jgi:hypothetical protein
MNFLNEVLNQGRRTAVEVLSGGGIERDAPFSPDVPDDLREWLPDLFDRFPIVLPWEQPKPVDPAIHSVWILDNTAFRSPKDGDSRPDLEELKDKNVAKPAKVDGSGNVQPLDQGKGWEVEYVACYFIKGSGKDVSKTVADIAYQLNVKEDDIATRKRIEKRIQPFVDKVLPNRTLRISIEGREEQTIGPSSYNGISAGLYELHFEPDVPGLLQTTPVNLPPPFSIPGRTVVADETGWGVISDIDDTIKVTMTPSPLGILESTFLVETPQPVEGMPELYGHMASALQHPPYFYLSASPYNLYKFLKQFREAHYPQGTMILRDASWQNLGGLISSLQQNVQAYKVSRMHKIHAWFPHRRFICIGDSTQSDPESYGEIARTFPGWVGAIFIRKVTGISEMDEKTKNSPERFEKAFKGLDRKLWHVFTDPSELAARIDGLASRPDSLVGGE